METRRIWVDRTGWLDLDHGSEAFWVGEDLFPGLTDLIRHHQPQPIHLYLAPDFFWLLRVTPAQLAQVGLHLNQSYGMKPGRWTWQIHLDHPDSALLLAMPLQQAQRFESLFLDCKSALKYFLVPQNAQQPGMLHYQMGNAHLMTQWGAHGLEAWGPSRESQTLPNLPSEWLLEPWTAWETESERKLAQLARISKRLWWTLASACLLVLVSVLALSWLSGRLQRESDAADQYMAAHLTESQQLATLVDSGNVAWEKLKEIQAFSRRHQPISHKVIMLSSGLPAGLKWTDLRWEGDQFAITLEGEQLQVLLDYVDFVRQVAGTEAVSFEEFKMKHRTNQFLGKVQGRFP